tara:strand:+ start:234 stop:593 length:360 start_codon:yes stop_codon:yes gene_type:complete
MEELRSLDNLLSNESCLVEFLVKNIEEKMIADLLVGFHIKDSNNLNPKNDQQFNSYHLLLAKIQTFANEIFYLEGDPFNLKLLSVVQKTLIERFKKRAEEKSEVTKRLENIEEQLDVTF